MLPRLREHAVAIFRAGLAEVGAERAIEIHVQRDANAGRLHLSSGYSFAMPDFKRVLVLGAGKAAARMAVTIERFAPAFDW